MYLGVTVNNLSPRNSNYGHRSFSNNNLRRIIGRMVVFGTDVTLYTSVQLNSFNNTVIHSKYIKDTLRMHSSSDMQQKLLLTSPPFTSEFLWVSSSNLKPRDFAESGAPYFRAKLEYSHSRTYDSIERRRLAQNE
jgi:hypothetical protein